MSATTTTIVALRKGTRTTGYLVNDRYHVSYDRLAIAWNCSSCKGQCKHTEAVINMIKAARIERQAKDAAISRDYEQERKLRQAEVERQRREAAPLNGNQGFSLMR